MTSVLDKITDMQKITLSTNDVMIIRVNVDNLQTHGASAIAYMEQLKNDFALYFLSNKILVVPDTISISIIGQENLTDA